MIILYKELSTNMEYSKNLKKKVCLYYYLKHKQFPIPSFLPNQEKKYRTF